MFILHTYIYISYVLIWILKLILAIALAKFMEFQHTRIAWCIGRGAGATHSPEAWHKAETPVAQTTADTKSRDPHLTGGERNKQSMNDVGKWSHWLVHCTCKYLINSVQASPNHRSKVCETSQLVLAAHVHQLEHSSLTGLPWSIRKWLQKKTRSSEVLPKLVFRHVSSLGISWNADNTHLRLHCWDWWIYVNLQNIPTKLAGCTGLWQLGPSHGYLHPFSKEAARVAPCELCRVAETSFKKVQEFRTLWKSRCSVGM